jgi:uncharacterized protein YraI
MQIPHKTAGISLVSRYDPPMNGYTHTQRTLLYVSISLLVIVAGMLMVTQPRAYGAPLAQTTPTGIFAEAIGEANVRSGPGIEYDLTGTIYAGTRYPALGQHEFFPWVLIEHPPSPDGRAWVFADLVTLSAPQTQLPYISENAIFSTPVATATQPPPTTQNAETPAASAAAPTAAPTTGAVYLVAEDTINVRFGPGVEYPRIERLQPGQPYTVISRHALYPWLMIDLPDSPNGVGWVFEEVVTVTGDVFSLPVITVEQVGWPTLTPTPPFVVTSAAPWQATNTPPSNPSPVDLDAVGDAVLALLLDNGFIPEEDSFGSVFILDLASGEAISLGRDIAYSGMSLVKIPILIEFYRQTDQPADARQAEIIANTMICSGNHTANDLLAIIGGGDHLAGAQQVTAMMQTLGLSNSFIMVPFDVSAGREPTPQPYPVYAPPIAADQTRSQPDPFNQITPEDLGWLLNAVYQCAQTESGPLLETFPGEFTPTECRQIIQTLGSNQINVLTEAGVPFGTLVAHKHGWINDTHGDAAIVFTPGGDFILTMALHQPEWLPYERSWPVMAEIARLVYNAYNPDAPLDAIHPSTVDETCDLVGNPLLADLTSASLPPINQDGE